MGTVSERIWNDILAAFRSRRPELHRPWFSRLELLDMEHGMLRVGTAEHSQYQYLSQQCQPGLTEAAQAVTGRLITVSFVPPPDRTAVVQPLTFEQETEHLVLNEEYTFDNFVTGPCNRLASAASVAVADNPGRVYNPLFIHGAVGLGKTHLLQAVCHRLQAAKPGMKVLYISCETFTNHFVEAIERGALHQFRYRYRHVDALLIDDVQFLAAREQSREEFFHTFNTLFQSHKQIILTADESPHSIPSLEDRLVSRFNWGLVVRIDPPSLETRMAIVRKKAKLRCAELPEDVVHYIAAHVTPNIRELEGALTRVLALSQQYAGAIDLDIARRAVGETPAAPLRPVNISDIVEIVTDRYRVRLTDLQGKRRHRSVAFPRQLCMFLARALTSLSLEEIGGYFGGRDHTTVLHAVKTVESLRGGDPELAMALRQMTDVLRQPAAPARG